MNNQDGGGSRALEESTRFPGAPRTKWDAIADVVIGYKRYIAGALAVVLVAGMLGWIDLPTLEFRHYFLITSALAGVTIGTNAVLYELSDYLTDTRVPVGVTPANSSIMDVIRIPRKTFSQFDILGKHFPERRTVTGETVFTARAIDFDNQVIVPAGEFVDDEKYPDDIDLIAEDADGTQIEKYRRALLEDARSYHEITVDEEVIKESAMGDAVDMFSKALRDVRDGDINLQHMNDDQVEVQAEQLIQQAAQASPEGGNDE